MDRKFNIYFSNQVEMLYPNFRDKLFSPQSSPFTKRIIIVPSPAMKAWLSVRLVEDDSIGVATGFKISKNLDAVIHDLTNQFCQNPETIKPPLSHLELALHIEKILRNLLTTEDIENIALWKPLLDYLHAQNLRSKKVNKRIVALSDKLAGLFIQYEKFGSKLLQDWMQPNTGDWQAELWRMTVGASPNIPTQWKNCDAQVHIFAISFLSRQQHQFFLQLSETIQVNYYLLSPCQAFWSDLLSDRQNIKVQQFWEKKGVSNWQEKKLEEYLYDRNPLLANFGRLGREMAEMLEESEVFPEEDYAIRENIAKLPQYIDRVHPDLFLIDKKNTPTILQAIQADLLLLRNPLEEEKIGFNHTDTTIQIHVAGSLLREVQILYNTLLNIITKHAHTEDIIFPGEIIVMAPDIMAYEPYIRAVFESGESKLSCQIMDLHLLSRSSLIQGFFHLLSLAESRWDIKSLLRLLDFLPFQKRHRFRSDHVQTIRGWLKEANVRWGEDVEHRNELLKNENYFQSLTDTDPAGTWQFAMDRLLMGLALSSGDQGDDNTSFNIHPVTEIDSSQAELLGKWIGLLKSLREDLKPLADGSLFSLKEWSLYLENLLTAYFDTDELDSNSDDLESNLRQILRSFNFKGADNAVRYPFSTVHYHLKAQVEKQKICYRENDLQAVRFCSMHPMRAVPAKVIALLGMQEEAFPRRETAFSLNVLRGNAQADYCPSQGDFDRYLFLEMLLSCRGYFIISYVGSSSEGKEQTASLLVEELISYIDKSYEINGNKPSHTIVLRHPFHSFNKKYFQSDSLFVNYSFRNFEEAKSFYFSDKEKKFSFVPQFNISRTNDSKEPLQINIKHLVNLARNPVQSYFNHTLGMYLDKDDKQISADEDFFMPSKESSGLKKQAIKKPVDIVLRHAALQGKLPIGPFKHVFGEKIKSESLETSENLEKLGVIPSQICKLEFTDIHSSPHRDSDNNWNTPPLEFLYKGELPIKIVGNIKDVAPEGLVAFSNDTKNDVLKHWPEYLVCACLSQQHGLAIQSQILFAKSGKAKTQFFDDPFKQLEKFIEYYFIAMENISPLIPEWVPDILAKDPKKFAEKITTSLSDNQYSRFYNDYFKWMYRNGSRPESIELIQEWKSHAASLYEELYANWFPGRASEKEEESNEIL